MLFNTVGFLVFGGCVLLVYWMLPSRVRYIWLLLASWFFYMQWESRYILLLLFVTTVTYIGGIAVEEFPEKSKKRVTVLTICLIVCLGILGIFKYANMGIQTINRAFKIVGIRPITWRTEIILPVGISFYILQSLGYLIDVYRGDTHAEKNYLKYALFVSFFPQLIAGPIERSKNLLRQLETERIFLYENIRKGVLLVVWGLFLKMVIADRIAVFVDAVYDNYDIYGGAYIIVATILFSVQIYCDFYGYSIIAKGVALTMGYSLTGNFNAPYFSKSVKEFWQRWHISLSLWFKDYLYIPLGGNRRGSLRKNINLLTVFSVSGLWHGASLAFVFWGILNGAYQVISNFFMPVKKRLVQLSGWREKMPEKILRTGMTFILISFAWLFFRAGGFHAALRMLNSIVQVHNYDILFDGSIYGLGISRQYFGVLLFSIMVLAYVDYRKYKGIDVAQELLSQHFWFRCLVEIMLIFTILLFGCYGEMYDATAFIYFQF